MIKVECVLWYTPKGNVDGGYVKDAGTFSELSTGDLDYFLIDTYLNGVEHCGLKFEQWSSGFKLSADCKEWVYEINFYSETDYDKATK